MMRIVLDSNVLARPSFSHQGSAAALLGHIKASDDVLLISAFIRDELDRVLRYPRLQQLHGLPEEELARYVQDIVDAATWVEFESADVVPVVPADPDDDWIVATAVAGGANVLCTCNKHLFQANVADYCRQQSIEIMKDDALLRVLRASGPSAP